MTTATLERPGVQVTQEFRTTSPTILVPTLPACIIGPCKQVVEAIEDDGSLNADAQLSLPARLAFSWVAGNYVGVGTDALGLSVSNAAEKVVTFATGPDLTPAQVLDDILEAAIPGLTGVVEESGSNKRVVIYTTSKGDNASLAVGASTANDVLTAFGIKKGYKELGRSGYTNYYKFDTQLADYPDPRTNLDELSVDYTTVRAFINDGAGNVREVLRTETFLVGAATAVTVQDDGDGDNLSPYLNFASAVFKDTAAVLTGTVDWTTLVYPGDFGVLTLEIFINGVTVVCTFAAPANAAAAIAQLNAALGVNGTATLNGSNQPVITSALTGKDSRIEIGDAGTITEATIGLVISRYASGQPFKARAQGIADISALVWATVVHGRVLAMSIDGKTKQVFVMPATIASAADVVTAINSIWGVVASLNDANNLVLVSLTGNGGRESCIRIDKTASDSTLLTALGLTGVSAPFQSVEVVYGAPYAPIVGDEVWVNGIRVGEITEIPVSPTNRLRLSEEQLLTFTGSSWSIVAKALDNDLTGSLTRPSSDFYIDEETGSVRVKHELFRETDGSATLAGPLALYLGYTALRLDVSPAGEDFTLVRSGSTTDLETALTPLDTQNPLGLGMYLAILNAPGVEVTGVGVDEVSTTEPEGSLDAYTKAFEYLESKDVYSLAPLTHSGDVGLIGQLHVDEMSEPENGLERRVLLNPSHPTRKSSTLVASGPTANVSGPPTNVVQSGIANLQALLAAAGKPGPSYVEADAVYVEFESDTNKYLVQSVSGGAITINDGPLTSNTDNFFYDGAGSPVFTAIVVDRPFTVKIRGATVADRTEEATAYADIARGYLDRRVICMAPDKAKATIDGLETLIEGYYACAAVAGKMSAINPQQPLTEEGLAGLSGVVGSTDRYSELQLKIMDGGGLWVLYQEADGQPVKTRHQLTTDMSTVEKREDSITRALDYTAKFVRTGLRNFIGRFNITTNVQDAISITLDGLGAFLVRQGVLKAFDVSAIRQSTSQPDTLEIDIVVSVLYPLNYIKVTLIV